jgi:hypothetical protein
MSLKLSKTATPAYDYYSEGDGTDPVSVTATCTGAGGTIDSTTVTAYLIATTFKYTDIELSVVNEQTGIDWKLSLNNSTWANTIEPSDMNALSADTSTTVYIKGVVTNDGTVTTGIYTTPDIQISSVERPI